MVPTGTPVKLARSFWNALALLSVGAATTAYFLGQDYYGLARDARHHAAEDHLLGPGGSFGHTLGIVGSAMMVANLLYLVRRRWARVEGLGEIGTWLAFHVALGVGGVAFVTVHAAMLFDNPIARISLIAAGIVLVTGVVGRWIYAQVPHRPDGHDMDEAELVGLLRARMTSVRPALRTAVEDTERALARIAAPTVSGPLAAAVHALGTPLALVRFWTTRQVWKARLAAAPYGLSAGETHDVLGVASQAALMRRRFRRQTAFKHMVGLWRGVHRVATFILLLTLVTHVVTVLYFSVGR